MQPLKVPAATNPLLEELTYRLVLGILALLSWQLTRIALAPIKDVATLLFLYSMIEVSLMVIVATYCGERNISRDINEFNFYALLMHMIAWPLYCAGITSKIHYYAIWILFGLQLVRIMYFGPLTENGDYKGLPTFGLLGHMRKLFADYRKINNTKALTHLPAILFFGAALPMWFIVYRTNDSAITMTVIGLMVFIFIVSNKMRQQADTTTQAQRAILDAYNNTHDDAKKVLVAVNKHLANTCPKAENGDTSTMQERRVNALNALSDVMKMSKDQATEKSRLSGNTMGVINQRLNQVFSDRLACDEVRSYMTCINNIKHFELSDTSLLLACNLLTEAWMRLSFTNEEEFRAEVAELTELTETFITKFQSLNYDAEN